MKRALSTSRLVTLTGVGGVGKTRLALQVAGDLRRTFPSGAWLAELDGLDASALLPNHVAAALGLREHSVNSRTSALVNHIGSQRLLLVLDNCEHLVGACAQLAKNLLQTCPELHILATSRQPLGLYNETVFNISPLSFPESDIPQEGTYYEAIDLFIDRAKSNLGQPDFAERNSLDIADICRQLEGIPLAIEMAAAWLRALPPRKIRSLLEEKFQILTKGSRCATDRQRTLRACIDWSYHLCSAEERKLWARISVFSGGFELDAANEICMKSLTRHQTLDLIASLVDQSILTRETNGGSARYRLLDTFRQYGREKLQEQGEWTALRRSHRDWFSRLVERADAEWISDQQVTWLNRLRREHHNLETALEFCLTATGEAEAALPIAADLHYYWNACGRLSEARYWLNRALRSTNRPTTDRARAIISDSWLATLQADKETSAARLNEGRALVRQLDDRSTRALIAQASGLRAMAEGELARAAMWYREALSGFRSLNDLNHELETILMLAIACSFGGDSNQAASWHEECIAITECHGESWFRSYALWALGISTWRQGDVRRAARIEKSSLSLKVDLDDQVGIAFCLESLAWIAATSDAPRRAATLFGTADSLWQMTGASTTAYQGMSAFHHECEARAHRALGDDEFKLNRQIGQEKTFQEALGFAMETSKRAPNKPAEKEEREPAILTRREREIATLVTEGLSNNEIANRLVISRRTTEAHLGHIYNKLGISSRIQLVTWLGETIRGERHEQ
ncbi:LuxR C-terminal-related transcriptional regulator [Saccharopolyspora sp. NPDC000995]